MVLMKGIKFDKYESLVCFISNKEREDCVKLAVFDSRTIEAAQSKGVRRPMNPLLKYYEITYKCIHSGQRKSLSTGQRPNQTTLRQECPFVMRLRVSLDGQTLEIVSFVDEHNHPHNQVFEELEMDCEGDYLHSLKNKKTKRKSASSKNNKFMCEYCGKLIVSNNVRRHELSCSYLDNRNDSKIYTCQKCFRKFCRLDGLKAHIASCLTSNKFSFLHSCLHKQCSEKFKFKTTWIEHMQNKHNFQIESPKVITFNSVPDFYKWKDEEEDKTCSFYTQQCGSNRGRFYFYCQHDDSLRKRAPPKTSRRVKVGSVKKGKRCLSMMQFYVKDDGTCEVKYFPTHSHAWNEVVSHQQQSDEETCDNIVNFGDVETVLSCNNRHNLFNTTECGSKTHEGLIAAESRLAVGMDEESSHSAPFHVEEVENEDPQKIVSSPLGQECFKESETTRIDLLPVDTTIEIVEEDVLSINDEQFMLNQQQLDVPSFNLKLLKEKVQQKLRILTNVIESDSLSYNTLSNMCNTLNTLVKEAYIGDSVEHLRPDSCTLSSQQSEHIASKVNPVETSADVEGQIKKVIIVPPFKKLPSHITKSAMILLKGDISSN